MVTRKNKFINNKKNYNKNTKKNNEKLIRLSGGAWLPGMNYFLPSTSTPNVADDLKDELKDEINKKPLEVYSNLCNIEWIRYINLIEVDEKNEFQDVALTNFKNKYDNDLIPALSMTYLIKSYLNTDTPNNIIFEMKKFDAGLIKRVWKFNRWAVVDKEVIKAWCFYFILKSMIDKSIGKYKHLKKLLFTDINDGYIKFDGLLKQEFTKEYDEDNKEIIVKTVIEIKDEMEKKYTAYYYNNEERVKERIKAIFAQITYDLADELEKKTRGYEINFYTHLKLEKGLTYHIIEYCKK